MRQSLILAYRARDLEPRRQHRRRWIFIIVAATCLLGWVWHVRMGRPTVPSLVVNDNLKVSMLDRQLPEVSFEGQPLKQALDFLSEVSGVPFSVDWNNLALIGLTPDTPVRVKLRNIMLHKALAIILDGVEPRGHGRSHFGLDADGRIFITSRSQYEKANTVTFIYDIRDITTPQDYRGPQHPTQKELGEQICHLITDTIDPDSWAVNGGTPGDLKESNGIMIVRQTRENQKSIAELLRQFRL